jgi:tetratricopeptide (TPR) repeat protein
MQGIPSVYLWMNAADAYRFFGLDPTASRQEVKVAYRRLARQHHPDINPQALQGDFVQLTQAYQLLLKRSPIKVLPAPASPEEAMKRRGYAQLQDLLRSGKYPRAVALVEGLAQRYVQDPEVRQWQAIIYQRWGRQLIHGQEFEKAERYLEKALKTDPNNRALLADVAQDLRLLRRMNHP